MIKHDLSNYLANEMDKNLNQNKELFSTAATIEKLAFKKVSEPDLPGEIEQEVEQTLETVPETVKMASANELVVESEGFSVNSTINSLLKISENLEVNGFERLAAVSLILVDRLIVEAKEKSTKKPSSSSNSGSKSKSKSSDKAKSKEKSKSKPMSKAERMKKMREAKNKKKTSKK